MIEGGGVFLDKSPLKQPNQQLSQRLIHSIQPKELNQQINKINDILQEEAHQKWWASSCIKML